LYIFQEYKYELSVSSNKFWFDFICDWLIIGIRQKMKTMVMIMMIMIMTMIMKRTQS
jgi:hypothetical protein